MDELTVAIGVARHLPHDLAIDLHPLHPAAQPGLQLTLTVEDGVIRSADPHIGLMHRSAEKLFEARDYRQVLMLANRHDWVSAFASELAVALVIEEAMGIIPPERATWSRTLLAEMTRISSHLLFIGAVASPHALALRERLVELQEIASGGRVHPMLVRIGGLAQPLSETWQVELARMLGEIADALDSLRASVAAALAGFEGLAVLTREQAIECAATGPVGRASGLALDLRRDAPYLAYGELADALTVVSGSAGDAGARFNVLLDEIPVSIALIDACLTRLADLGPGPVDVPLPKVVRVPEGTHVGQIESSMGVAGVVLVSTGEKTPWRLKLRTPSFASIQAMATALPGTRLADLSPAVTSFWFVPGDADR